MLSTVRATQFDGTDVIDASNGAIRHCVRVVVGLPIEASGDKEAPPELSGANRPKECNLPELATEWDQIHGERQFR